MVHITQIHTVYFNNVFLMPFLTETDVFLLFFIGLFNSLKNHSTTVVLYKCQIITSEIEIMMKKYFFMNEDGSFRVLSSDAALKQFYENGDGSRIVYTRCSMTYDNKRYMVFIDVNLDIDEAYLMFNEIIEVIRFN